MDRKTIKKLNSLNKEFYSEQAGSFDQTRQSYWPGWEKVIKMIDKPSNILDAGCGNGRFLRFLLDRTNKKFHYLGIDSSNELIKIAGKEFKDLKTAEFKVMDVLDEKSLSTISGQFELITAFGLLHHIPGFENRIKLLQNFANKLKKNGSLIVTFWQFMKYEKYKNLVLPADLDLKPGLEENDFLLDWNKSGIPRYCHYFSNKEIEKIKNRLKKDLPFLKLVQEFSADGKEGNLNRYVKYISSSSL